MKSFCSLIPIQLLLISLQLALVSAIATAQEAYEDPADTLEPGERDEFSGRTIEAGNMAGELITARNRNAPLPGEKAPPLRLYSLERSSATSLKEMLGEKPLVLVFSSWTCNVFTESAAGLSLLAEAFNDEVDFAFVYVREAHPGDGDFGAIPDPVTDRMRIEAARRFKKQTRLPFPIFVDSVSDRAATRWAAWPLRIYVVDPDTTVTYSGAQGPWGYRPYEEFLHGDGVWYEMDEGFNHESLEQFLALKYKKKGN